MRQQLLLLQDVESLGKSGDIVQVKSGYARNFLLPQKKGVIASAHTLRMQKKLQEERAKQAQIDRKESEEVAKKLAAIILKTEVKVDPAGKMYGSIGISDILTMLREEGIELSRRMIRLIKPIKEIGSHQIEVRLKEEVDTRVALKIIPEGVLEAEVDQVEVPVEEAEELTPTEEELQPPVEETKLPEQEKKEIKKATKKI